MFKVIPLLFFTNSLIAQNHPVELLNTAQVYVGSMSAPVNDPLCANCSEQQLAQRCYADICNKMDPSKRTQFGMGGSFGTGGQNPFNSNPGSQKERAELSKKITAIIQNDIDAAILEYSDKQKVLDNNLFKNDEATKIASIFSLIDIDNEENVKKLPPSLQDAHKKINDLLTKQDNVKFPDTSNLEYYYTTKYPGISLQEAVKKEITEIEAAESKFLKHPLLSKISAFQKVIPRVRNLGVYNDIMSGKEYLINDTEEMLTNFYVIQILQTVFDSPKLLDLIKNIDVQKVKEISKSSQVKSNLAHFNNTLQELKKNAGPGSGMVEYCVNQIISAKNNLADGQSLEQIKKRGENIKSTFFSNVIAKFSLETSKKIKENMKSWSFFTETKSDFIRTIDAQIRSSTNDSLKELQDYKSLSEEEKIPINSSLIEFVEYDRRDASTFVVESLSNYESLCVENIPDEFDDAAYTVSGRINVSYGSIKNPETGDAIMMHELGHLLEKQFEKKDLSAHSTQKFKTITACLESKHNSTEYISEDFADLASALALKPQATNFACSFLSPYEIDHSLAQPSDDEHSADFFRLLHIEKAKEGNLSQSCKRFIEVTPIKKNFDSCWPTEASK